MNERSGRGWKPGAGAQDPRTGSRPEGSTDREEQGMDEQRKEFDPDAGDPYYGSDDEPTVGIFEYQGEPIVEPGDDELEPEDHEHVANAPGRSSKSIAEDHETWATTYAPCALCGEVSTKSPEELAREIIDPDGLRTCDHAVDNPNCTHYS